MPANRTKRPSAQLLQAIAQLRLELTGAECRARAARMFRQHSVEGRADMVSKLREHRKHIARHGLQEL